MTKRKRQVEHFCEIMCGTKINLNVIEILHYMNVVQNTLIYLGTRIMLDNGLHQYWFFFSGINCQWHILSFFPTYNVENSPHFLEKKM